MSAAFTSPTGATWQTLLNEITLAWSERRQAIGQEVYTPTALANVQRAVWWNYLQAWLEFFYLDFIDHINGPLDDSETSFRRFTLATWRAAAGLNPNGFRRKSGPKEALIESYGLMQPGDAIGPWIFEDLQKGFGALKWTYKFQNTGLLNERNATSSVDGQCATNYALANALFASMAWGLDIVDSSIWYYADARYEDKSPAGDYNQHWLLGRGRGKAMLTGPLPAIPRSAAVYALPTAWNQNDGGQFRDIDALGCVEGKLFHALDLAETDAESMVSDYFGDNTLNPNTQAPNAPGMVCSAVPTEQNYQYNIQFTTSYWLLKWNFTNV